MAFRFRLKIFLLLLLLSLFLFGTFLYLRPLPQPVTSLSAISSPASTLELPWPTYGQAVLMEKDFGLLTTHGQHEPRPIASTAKIITALAVMKQKPLKLSEQGPEITIDQTDVDAYNSYYQRGGAVTKVVVDQKLSQYQALQAMLIPSSNNMADTLARWAFGSVEEYIKYANDMLDQMHLPQTRVADATGFSKDSRGTAEDLAKLGQALLENKVLAAIVAQESVELPLAGKVNNVNWLLGSDGVRGIKTGNTDEAGGCFVFAADREVLGRKMTFIGAFLGAPTRNQAISDSRTLLKAADGAFEKRIVAKKDQPVGSYQAAWGESAEIIISDDFSVIIWKGWNLDVQTKVDSLDVPAKPGEAVGSVSISVGGVSTDQELVLKDSLDAPAWHWRLLR